MPGSSYVLYVDGNGQNGYVRSINAQSGRVDEIVRTLELAYFLPEATARITANHLTSMGYKTYVEIVVGSMFPAETPAEVVRREFVDRLKELETENARLNALINSPQIDDFFNAVRVEVAHQSNRWGEDHDRNKSLNDWVALFTALTGKVVQANWDSKPEKILHHLITIAAAAANAHKHVSAVIQKDR